MIPYSYAFLIFFYFPLPRCFNSAFQKVLTMKEPLLFFDKSVAASSTSKLDLNERKSLHSNKGLLLNQKEAVLQNNIDSPIPPLPPNKNTHLVKESGESNGMNPQHHKAFYAKAGIKRPLYSGGDSSLATTTASSNTKSPSTTNAFLGLIAVICLTSAVFVKGIQEAHTRWNEVTRRWEQSRQALIALESSNNAFIDA
jgi:hypothetical protein